MTTRMPGRPLAVKLAALVAGLSVLGLALAGTAITVALRIKLVDEVDRQLTQSLSTLSAPARIDAPIFGPSDYVLMIFAPDGSRLGALASEARQNHLPALEHLDAAEAMQRRGEPFTVEDNSGDGKWRVVAAMVAVGPRGGESLALALPLTSVDATTRQMAMLVVWITLAAACVATAIGYVLVKRSLQPLIQVEQAAARIAAGDLTTRMPAAQEGTEIGRLTESLNAMLSQIEEAFAAQRQSEAKVRAFASDASHELRNPLAAIRGYAELYRLGGLGDPEEQANAIRRIEQEATRMGLLVEDLLTLTRLDEGQRPELAPVNLSALVADAVADTRAMAPDRDVTVVWPAEPSPESAPDPAEWPELWVAGDDPAIRRVLANLLANAVRYAPQPTPIEVVLTTADNQVRIAVQDHGPGIPADQASRIFDRFHRLDGSRSRDLGGSGLGLAIVDGLVTSMGGHIKLTETPGGGATFSFELRSIPTPEAAG
ncbi:MAG: HAMP domain-containing histidine kinase [Bifidobacteriaceae bacterium]|jgi:two-component system OmpR family sensor kinase|nr:HAMP domain-containing histidine kinase [Bifidobacteriaceae bacterium]